jgi:hypothetical protein
MMADLTSDVFASVTYHVKSANSWMIGGTFLVMSLPLGYIAISQLLMPLRFPSGPDLGIALGSGVGMASLSGLCCLAGALLCIGARRGTAGVTLTKKGLRITSSLFRDRWADWSSLTPFVEGTYARPSGPNVKCARARIVGPGVSKNLRRWGEVVILDNSSTPIAEMIDEMNAWRAKSTGRGTVPTPVEAALLARSAAGSVLSGWVRGVVSVAVGVGVLAKIYVQWIAPHN